MHLIKNDYDVVQATKNKSSFLSHTIKHVLWGWGGGVAANLAHLGSPPKQKHSRNIYMHADLDGARSSKNFFASKEDI